MMIFGSRAGYGTNLLIVGAIVFQSGAGVTVVADPDFAGATVHRAHIRTVAQARLRGVVPAHLRRKA